MCPTTSGQVRLWGRICALFVPAPFRFGYCRGGPAPTTTQIRQAVAEIEQALVDAERVFWCSIPGTRCTGTRIELPIGAGLLPPSNHR